MKEGPFLGLRNLGERNTVNSADPLYTSITMANCCISGSFQMVLVCAECSSDLIEENFGRHISACSGTKCRRALSDLVWRAYPHNVTLSICTSPCLDVGCSHLVQLLNIALCTHYIYLNSYSFLRNWSNFEEKNMP